MTTSGPGPQALKPSGSPTSVKTTLDKQALKPASTRKSVPPLPNVGFAPVRLKLTELTFDRGAL